MVIKEAFNKYRLFFILFLVKIIVCSVFSSDYKDLFFVPFVSQFLSTFENPWHFFHSQNIAIEFPYHPFMLYILSLFYWPISFFNVSSPILSNILFKLPLLLSDLLITVILIKQFPKKTTKVLLYYALSPIILYATYMHSQLDIIPTAFFILSLALLFRHKIGLAGLIFGLALSTKLHILLGLPFILVYFFRQKQLKSGAIFLATSISTYAFFTLPYLLKPGFLEMVLQNKRQALLFNLVYPIGQNHIYLIFALLLLIYFRFFLYKKINQDLMYSMIGLMFSLMVLFVFPAPGWYVWLVPFFSIFFIKSVNIPKETSLLFLFLNVAYVIFYIFFHQSEINDLTFLATSIYFEHSTHFFQNISFTLLEVSLVMMVFILYRFGIKSNAVYQGPSHIAIGIGGDSGSGKSTLLSDIKQLSTEHFLELEADGAHKWERGDKNWEKFTHSDPKANNLHQFSEQLMQLKKGLTTPIRFYDHCSGKFTKPFLIQPKKVILLSGLHPFYLPIMRKTIDIKIFMDTQESLRKKWKIERDVSERNKGIKTVLKSLLEREKDSKKHIQTQKQFSDITIHYHSSKKKELLLTLTCKADINIDEFLNISQTENAVESWDYGEDLETISINFSKPLSKHSLDTLTDTLIPNQDELVQSPIDWAPEYRGLCQFFILYILSEKLKHKDQSL